MYKNAKPSHSLENHPIRDRLNGVIRIVATCACTLIPIIVVLIFCYLIVKQSLQFQVDPTNQVN